jgi:hypothetical protein
MFLPALANSPLVSATSELSLAWSVVMGWPI